MKADIFRFPSSFSGRAANHSFQDSAVRDGIVSLSIYLRVRKRRELFGLGSSAASEKAMSNAAPNLVEN